MTNLGKILQSRTPSNGITFINSEEKFLSYRELFTNALKMLTYFHEKGLKKGSKLIFQLNTNENFVNAFWTSIVGGIVAVPVTVGNNDEHRLKLLNIYNVLDDAYLILDSNVLDRLETFAKKNSLEESFSKLKEKTIDIRDIDLSTLQEATMQELHEDALALIQFSSGSTGDPKGVMLTHKNIIENAKSFFQTAQITQKDSYLSWFPLTHDMGLMGWHINPLILDVNQVLIETNYFVRRPLVWLDSATKFKSSILCSPNFGYKYFLKFLKSKQKWDLSSIRLIFNGAEPISASICDEFLETLAPYGLQENTMYTVYGLAEATLVVTFPKPSEKFRRYHLDLNHLSIGDAVKDIHKSENGVTYVDVGYTVTNMQIRITRNGNVLDENYIGHIEMKGISVTQGYFNNVEATNSAKKEDGWFDTGDLGFLRENRLVITGRAKDIIIINGINYYPHDIENVCFTLKECELNKVVAVGSRGSSQESEALIIFVLFKKAPSEFLPLAQEIKKIVLSKMGLEVEKVIPTKTVYKTTSGKLQRHKLLQQYEKGAFKSVIEELDRLLLKPKVSKNLVLSTLTEEANKILSVTVDPNKPLFEQGFSSISLVAFNNIISKKLDIDIDITAVFDYPTINSLASYLSHSVDFSDDKNSAKETQIAIISTACKFPDATSPEIFFDNLLKGVDSVKKSTRWEQSYDGAFLDNQLLTDFDNDFFDIPLAEANTLDPQEKILLQTSLELLERGAVDFKKEKNIGVFIGVSSTDNLRIELSNDLNPYTLTSNLSSTLSGRLSYYFDLKAPALSIDTACSSSLVAIHQAINAINNGDCNMAIAGGVNVILDTQSFEALSKMQALSKSGRCRTFDEDADGYVRGEGCGLVLLKPLEKALQDRDEVLAVIKSSTINHDGKSNGLTAPNGLSQQALLQKAYKDVENVDFIETHGTGTNLGDPIEINALASALTNQEIFLGAVKTNIGHLESAAGAAGVIKTLMAMKYKKLPKNLHFTNKNPFINWDRISLKPLTENSEWSSNRTKVAGVSSFGFSGTNAHIVLEEYKKQSIEYAKKEHKLLLVSAKNEQSLDKLTDEYLKQLNENNEKDFLYSASQKYQYEHKRAILGKSVDEFISKENIFNSTSKQDFKTIFVFTGQGSQYKEMAKELFDNEILFKEYFLECDDIFKEYLDRSLYDLIFQEDESLLNEPLYAQASIFSVEYALAKYMMELNIIPDAVTGHSLGEYVAATICESITLKEAIILVITRAQLITSLERKGAMYTFVTSEEKIFDEINRHFDSLSIAAVNSKNRIVVSGDAEVLESLAQELRSKGIKSVKLNISQAYHSVLLDSILLDFYYEANKIEYKKPKIPFISATKSMQLHDLDANYFSIHFRNSVRFADTVEFLNSQKYNLFIEIGPDAHLTPLIMEQSHNVKVYPTLRKNRAQSFYETLANLYVEGFEINWNKFYLQYGQKIPLPTHPMQNATFQIAHLGDRSSQVLKMKPTTIVNEKSNKPTNYLQTLKEFVYQVSGLKNIDEEMNIFELGIDSLSLFQLRENIKKEFALEIDMKNFYNTLNTLHAISEYISKNSSQDETPTLEQNYQTNVAALSDRDLLIQEQITSLNNLTKLHVKQLEALTPSASTREKFKNSELVKNAQLKTIKTSLDELTSKQQNFLNSFIIKYNERSKKSKKFNEKNKKVVSDWVGTIIYRQSLKEITYPIVAKSADGANFYDKDDNRYIDISMGYGSVFLGHNHTEVKKAMQATLDTGFVLSPQTELARKVALLVQDFTKSQKVCFSNTGTEAVMATVRLLRAKTKKTKIVKFQGSFHGTSDTILATGDENGSYPTSLGVTFGSVEDIIEFQYGSPKIFDYLKTHSDQIAGVLAEPVQSRRTDYHPKEFLQELRKVTKDLGIALVFDEMITGFRCARGGAGELFDIKADISIFGKVLGGTMPIGLIAGDAKYLDLFDGGDWEYGDESYPAVDMMTFGGTFCKHPMTLSASLATLKVLEDNPNIQEEVNQKTDYLAKTLNSFFQQNKFPIKLNNFGSLFRFDFYGEYATALHPIEIDLFFYLLLYKGIFTWEKRVCFLSASHTQSDLDTIIEKVKEALFELKKNGFFTKTTPKDTQEKCEESFEFTIDKTDINQPFRLNDIQQAYWMGRGDVSDMGNVATHGFIELQSKNLDVVKFQDAWQKVIQRHDMLRVVIDSEGYQQILKEVEFTLPVIDCASMQENELEEFLDKERRYHSHKVLEVTKAPILDVRVYQLPKNIQKVFLYIDMLVCDATSIPILAQDLEFYYNNKDKELAPLALSFRDYVLYEKSFEKSLEYEKALSYWKNRVHTLPLAPQLPHDKNQSEIEKVKNVRFEKYLDETQWNALKEYAKKARTTPNVLLMALFSKVLALYAKEPKFTLNLTLFNRVNVHPDIEKVVGDFTSLTLLEIDADPKIDFEQLCGAIQEQLFDDLDNRMVSAVRVLRELREAGRELLMPVVFTSTLGTDDDYMLEWIGEKQYLISQTPQVWIDYQVAQREGELEIVWDCIDDFFPENMLSEMFALHTHIIEKLISNAALENHDLVSENQKKLIAHYNDTKINFAELNANSMLYSKFLENVKNIPENIAIESDERVLTYRQLHSYASQVAKKIEGFQIGANEHVAIYLEKGWEQIVAVLATNYIGAAYLPIASDLPIKRVEYLINEVEAKVVFSTQKYMEKLNIDIPFIDIASTINPDENTRYECKEQNSDNLAYTIFTSGSTGTPKGVMISHRGALNTITDINKKFDLSANDKVFAISALNFDLSVYDIFGTLSTGATLVIPKEDERKDPKAWCDQINKYKVTIWNSAPALMTLLLEEHCDISSLRVILLSGDYISVELAKNILDQKNGDCKLISLGGATEVSIWSIYYPIEQIDNSYKSIPYGYPLANQTLYVLNKALLPSPFNTVGDIYIGGVGLSKGYFKDKSKTDDAFITNPMSGEKLYKTGDLGIFHKDGLIEFIGREDKQIQIQGYRVELSEIENNINSFENVKENVTIAIDENNQKTVNSFVVLDTNQESEDEIDIEGFLNNPLERAEFKLSQKGNRELGNETKIELPFKHDSIVLSSQARLKEVKESSKLIKDISFDTLAKLLNSFANTEFNSNPLPKYFYPSAGSLYPIQIYLYVPKNSIEGLNEGYYYYDRANHQLDLITSEKNSSEFVEFYFVSKIDAIQPMYGPIAEGFCSIEVGHMYQLLLATSSALSLGVAKAEIDNNLYEILQLDQNSLVSKTCKLGQRKKKAKEQTTFDLSLLQRQSFREFQDFTLEKERFEKLLQNTLKEFDLKKSRFDIYIYIKKMQGYQEGYYIYDSDRLHLITQSSLPASLYNGRNRDIYNMATFSIFLVAKESKKVANDSSVFSLEAIENETLINAGYYAQLLMNYSFQEEIGLCPIGFIETAPIREFMEIDDEEVVIYSFLGGKISQEQTTYWASENEKAQNRDYINELREHLKKRIPEYMVPSSITLLDKLPLSANGKVDTKALIKLRAEVKVSNKEHVQPRDEIEKMMAAIFSEILEVENIGVFDNFFELGGHSLKAAKMVNVIRKAFDIEFPIKHLFTQPTVAELSLIIKSMKESELHSSVTNAKIEKKFTKKEKNKEVPNIDGMQEIEL